MKRGKRQSAFEVERVDHPERCAELRFRGKLTFADVSPFWRGLRRELRQGPPGGMVVFDLSGVDEVDGGAMALLVQLRTELDEQGVRSEVAGASGRVGDILALYQERAAAPPSARARRRGMLDQLGRLTAEFLGEAQRVFGFVGSFLVSAAGVLRRLGTANWGDVPAHMERAGADGLPIVLLINFLVGLVMAFQGAVQLKQFGANIFVADLVGLSITRELGPLMTAIIVCGRSGASYAAELGTMKVNEEIDALRTMGFDPLRFLVFPRAVALMAMMPMLTLLADLIALFGGMLVGVFGLDLTFGAYIARSQQALDAYDVFSGVIKSLVFGLVIALIACQQGLSATGGAQGVGRRTTSSVVATLFALIVVDAAFTVLMTIFDI